jgi:protein-tyrosine-phosphatase
MKKLLFVCVENSCRSQMAEGFARLHGAGKIEAYSAGSKPSGKVNETAVLVMKEKAVDLNAQRSKGLSGLPPGQWDALVTMGCGDACPTLPAKRRLDWALPDPKHMPLDEFRKVRDDIEARVKALIEDIARA